MVSWEVGRSKEHRGRGVVNIEQIILLIVSRWCEANSNLWTISADWTRECVISSGSGLNETAVVGLHVAIVELLWKEEGHAVYADSCAWSCWIDEPIDHAFLANSARPLVERPGWEVDHIEEGELILYNGEITNSIRNSIVPRCTGCISVCVCIPVVAGYCLPIRNSVSEVDENASLGESIVPCREVVEHVEHHIIGAHWLASKSVRIGDCLSSIGLNSCIAVLRVDHYLSWCVDSYLLDFRVLDHVGDSNASNIPKSILELIIGSKSGHEWNGQWVSWCGISRNSGGLVATVEFDIDWPWSPNLGSESIGSIIILVRIAHSSKDEAVRRRHSLIDLYDDNVIGWIRVALPLVWSEWADSWDGNLWVISQFEEIARLECIGGWNGMLGVIGWYNRRTKA